MYKRQVLTTERIPQAMAETIIGWGLAPWQFLIVVNIIPVSYTHLDVYKRQGRIAGIGQQMDIRLCRLLPLLPPNLLLRCPPRRLPLIGIDAAIATTVKQRHAFWIAFPAFQQFCYFPPGVRRLAQATNGCLLYTSSMPP